MKDIAERNPYVKNISKIRSISEEEKVDIPLAALFWRAETAYKEDINKPNYNEFVSLCTKYSLDEIVELSKR